MRFGFDRNKLTPEEKLMYIRKYKRYEFPDLDQMSDRPMLPNMIYLFTRSENTEVQNLAFKLMLKFFNQRKNLIKSLDQVQLLTEDDDIDQYEILKEQKFALAKICEQSSLWVHMD